MANQDFRLGDWLREGAALVERIGEADFSAQLLTAIERVVAQHQHAEMVAAYREAGVEVHFLPADPALKYQIFARDSSVMTPFGPIVTQMAQWWRRGEYAPVTRFYQALGLAVYDPDIAMIACGGGGVHCRCQPLRRDSVGL